MAASIPVLRVLFRQVKATTQRRCGTSSDRTTRQSKATRNNTVSVTAHRSRRDTQAGTNAMGIRTDDSSDRSILESGSQSDISGNKIVQTREVAVEFHAREDGDDCRGYELDKLGRARQE